MPIQAVKRTMHMTTQEVAQKYGVTPRRIRAIAQTRGIKPAATIHGGHMWSKAQVLRLKPRKRGQAGHMKYLGKTKR